MTPPMPSAWPPRPGRSPLDRLRQVFQRTRWLRVSVFLIIVLILALAGVTMMQSVIATATVQTAADHAAQTAAEIGGNATTTERDAVVAAAQTALPGWIGVHTGANQVQVVCSSPCMRHSPMTVSVDATGRSWVPLGPLGHVHVSAHATRSSTGDQELAPTEIPIALAIATPLPPQPTSTPDPMRTTVPTMTPDLIPTGLPEPTMTATAQPTSAPAAPEVPRQPAPPPPPSPPPPPPTATPAPADLSIRSGGTRFDVEQNLVIVTLLVVNEGASPADGVVVQQILPDGVTLVDSTVPSTRTGQETRWDLGTVAPQETRLIIALVQPGDRTSLSHQVGVTSRSPEQRTDNNQTSATVTW